MKTLFDSDAVKRVARTFVYAFLGILVPGLLGWLGDLTDWARANGQAPLPDAHSLAYLGVAAIGAGFVAVLNALGIAVENATGVTPGRAVADPVTDTAMGETIDDEPDEVTVPTVPVIPADQAKHWLKADLVAYVSGEPPTE